MPNVGLISVCDAETGHEMVIDTADQRLRRQHHDHWLQQERKLSDTLSRCRVDCASIATSDDYARSLLRLFKQRGR